MIVQCGVSGISSTFVDIEANDMRHAAEVYAEKWESVFGPLSGPLPVTCCVRNKHADGGERGCQMFIVFGRRSLVAQPVSR